MRGRRMQTNRREVLALFASGIALASGLPAAASAQELKKVRVGKAIISSFPFSGLELGTKQGIWKSVGLDAEISTFAGDGRLQQALTAGSIDFGFGSGPGMGYAAKGVPAHAVAAVANRPANMALVVAKGSRVTNMAELKGKRIGASTPGSLTDGPARNLAPPDKAAATGIEPGPAAGIRRRRPSIPSVSIKEP